MKKRGRSGQAIMCCNDGCVYSSIHEAAKTYAISTSTIARQIQGERKLAARLYFVAVSGNESHELLNEIRLNVLKAEYRLKGIVLK